MKKPVQYDPAKIEPKWQKKWASSKIYKTQEAGRKEQGEGAKKYYVLDMFPYPSGEGLHVGHPKGYIATDVISRMKRMQGYSVLHPMGFDAFGLPAENYAIKMKVNPAIAVAKNVKRFKEQLEILGFDYDWSREVNTTDPEYYRWTQWIFLQLFKKGLAYESYEPVNWCPTDKTVLANEDVENGRCERCGTPVEKKSLRQWVLRITDYADRLLRDLDATDYVMPKLVDESNPHRPGKPLVKRDVAHAVVWDPKTRKYLIIRNKKHGWDTVVIGGIESGESPEETARREVREETGYVDLEFKRILGGQVEVHFYAKHKDINRIGFTTGVYFELKSDKRVPIGADEDKDDEIIWVDEKDFVPGKMINSELPLWLERIKDPNAGWPKPFLNWPESIKEAQRNWIGRSEGAEINFPLTKKYRYVLLHGFTGKPSDNIYVWLKKELESRGHSVIVPELPNTERPSEEEQVSVALKATEYDESTILYGHSLGTVVAMKVAEKLNKKIAGLVLAGGFVDAKFKDHPRNFTDRFVWKFNAEKIKDNCGFIKALHDINDVAISDGQADRLASLLDIPVERVVAQTPHFDSDEEPLILKALTPTIPVFTTRPDTLFGVTYLVLAPEHPWIKELLSRLDNKAEVEAYISRSAAETEIERTDAKKEKTGVELKGVKAINPANKEEVPVWIADYVLADYGTGAVMAVPAHDERDWEFAKKFGLKIKDVIVPTFGEPNPKAEKTDGSAVIVFDQKKGLYACLHWRDPERFTIVAGGREGNESYEETAKRELAEEAGITKVISWHQLGQQLFCNYWNHSKGVFKLARSFQFLAVVDSGDIGETKREAHEKFDLEWKSAEEILKLFEETIPKSRHFFDILGRAVYKLKELGLDKTTDIKKFDFVKGVPFLESGILIDSGSFSGKTSDSVKKEITAFVSGKWVTKYKLRDWVFSRQRYWGEPIPLVHCDRCGVVPIPEKDLPVKLPKVDSYEPTGTGESPLAAISKWVNVKCPKCKGPAKRETNTMPQWAGSCWYYLRYEDPKNKKALVDPKKEKYWSPVDLYVGGAEHATRHLIYARFWHKFLNDIGVVSTSEPFTKLQSVGIIMGEDGRKMSKRFGNVVNPDDVVKTFGADTLRIYEMFMGPFDQSIAWSTESMVGPRRFIERVWKLKEKVVTKDGIGTGSETNHRIVNKAVKKVTEDIAAMRFNTAISTLMIALNEIEKSTTDAKSPVVLSRADFETYLKLLAPFAPHVTEELWTTLGNKKSIHVSEWPKFDPKLIVDDEANIIVQINGKVRASFKIAVNSSEEDLKSAALALPETKKWLEGKTVKKVIVVKGKLVSIVVG